ncbi:FUSC family protein [Streptomyces tsukubensis]|uniref:Integral membrane bound transporter domain-containing protein n=1 Tax=Streptomyces tsukubensis TaxID=83656 RepID=A0A1V3ZZL5_9ACTN|nr:FUSC family protein [Streptomyces tsukubensis]OON71788.1 hypothetical protein B1H18_32445 [Streptomyces tsukubensis]QFR97024.1 FUSC family protein [Streptomyces tsukubensis]
MSSPAEPPTPHRARRPRLPLAGVLRPARPSDIWFKPASSVVVSAAVPNLILLALGRLDLAMYTMAGSLCALFCHNLPYAARARTHAWVVVGMVAGLAVGLLTASLTTAVPVLIAVAALLAAAQKTLCEATRVGPPGNLVFTFISSATLFAPQHFGQVPGHLALAAGAGAVAWLVTMAPALVRPEGPERRATARALRAAAEFAATGGTAPGHERARSAAAGAVHAAWQSLLATGARTPARRSLERLVVRAEVALAAPEASEPERLRALADSLRGSGPVPHPHDLDGVVDEELLGVDAELAEAARRHPLLRALAPGSALWPIALRTAIGCALAGYASYALGVGRPYWAIVTAASLYQANVVLTWKRGIQRVVGNLAGVVLFGLISPVADLGPAALVLFCLAFSFGAEALMSRNYWLGSICVTPMALLITEFARYQGTGGLMADRAVDTVLGAVVGVLAAFLVTNRRASDHIEHALTAVQHATEAAESALAGPAPGSATLEGTRRTLAGSLVDLRAAVEAASGEWWQRALPQERVVAAERAGHRTLAATVRRQGLRVLEDLRDLEDTTT